jgi:hypothetical protein
MLRKKVSGWPTYAVLTVVICLAVGIASAQTTDEPTNTYQLTYYSNSEVAATTYFGGTVHIVNPGTSLTKINANGAPINGNLCADIYVLNNDEQLLECCGCNLTPDSERTLFVDKNLLANPVNPYNLTNDGVIKIVSGALPCQPYSTVKPVAGLNAFGTHIQYTAGEYWETETAFASAPLSDYELENLEDQCSAIFTSGSGPGVCTCGTGD